MRRVVSVCLPRWPTDRLRARTRPVGNSHGAPSSADPREGGDPIPFVIASGGPQRVVTAIDAVAQAAGLRRGMALAHARAITPTLAVADSNPEGDAEGLRRLALWALRYSPMAAADPPDGLWIDVTGASHLRGGERPLLEDLVGRLAAMGLAARAASADTLAAAHAVARFGRAPIAVLPATAGGAVALPEPLPGLPIAALRLPPDMVGELRRLGFQTIGDLAATPRAPLAHRFGPLPGRRLDQIHGRAAEPMTPVVPTAAIQARAHLVEPISTAEALQTVIARLLRDACAAMERRGVGARTLDLLFQRVDGTAQAIRVGTARPSRDPAHLARLLTERLDRVDPGFGVEAAALSATLTEALSAEEIGRGLDPTVTAASPDGDARALAGLIDLLGNRIGHDRVFRCAPVDSDVPERSVARIPALSPPVATDWPAQWPRPGRLLTPPEPIETLAMLPDHPPMAFTWRGVRRRVRRADGPERIHGEWWRRDRETAAARDYYAVEAEGGERFWLFRSWDGSPESGPMRWFLHGLFG
jgi:protein ImuB